MLLFLYDTGTGFNILFYPRTNMISDISHWFLSLADYVGYRLNSSRQENNSSNPISSLYFHYYLTYSKKEINLVKDTTVTIHFRLQFEYTLFLSILNRKLEDIWGYFVLFCCKANQHCHRCKHMNFR